MGYLAIYTQEQAERPHLLESSQPVYNNYFQKVSSDLNLLPANLFTTIIFKR